MSRRIGAEIRVRLLPAERVALKAYAKKQGRTISNLVRHVVVAELRRRGVLV